MTNLCETCSRALTCYFHLACEHLAETGERTLRRQAPTADNIVVTLSYGISECHLYIQEDSHEKE